jgi:hypothetical protein
MSQSVLDQRITKSRWPLAAGLFFLSPLIAEFLLGDLPLTMLPALIVLAPMYGGGAVLIREIVRRTGRGWPSMVVLAMVYGIFEEALTTQSLFNTNYLHLNAHLLDASYIPALGIGAWWTVFVLTLHTVWSISTSIALMEALEPERSTSPWLGRVGLIVVSVLFVLGAVANTLVGYKQDHFLASRAQLGSAALISVVLVLIAFRIPQPRTVTSRSSPNPWLVGVLSLIAGSTVLLVQKEWGWWAAISVFGIDMLALAAVLFWSRSRRWNMRHKLALAGGAALAYAWHGFVQTPATGHVTSLVRIGNVIFAAGAVALIATATAKNRSTKPQDGADVISLRV